MKRHERLERFTPVLLSVSFLFLAVLVVLGAAAPWLPLPDPAAVDLLSKNAGASSAHWFGTDHLGRDVAARLVWGIRTTLFSSLLATVLTAGFGIVLGIFSAAAGGRTDRFLMRVTDLWMSFPGEVLILALVGVLGPGLENVLLACLIAKWPWYARMSHAMVLHLLSSGFVRFAKLSGAGRGRILRTHLLPNLAGECAVLTTVDAGAMVLLISSLSFLGLGAQPPSAEWGVMLSDARLVMSVRPEAMLPPGLAIVAVVTALHFLGDRLRDAFDVKGRRS